MKDGLMAQVSSVHTVHRQCIIVIFRDPVFNLLGFITVIKMNSSRRLKYRFGIRFVTFGSYAIENCRVM